MIPSQLLPLANHLWQTTLFAGASGLLTILLRKNRAQVRYWLWIAASVKFLIPFSVLMDVGGLLRRHTAAEITPSRLVSAADLSFAIEQVSEPFTATPPQAAASGLHWSHAGAIVPVVIAFWAVGFVLLVCRWTMRWRRMRVSVRKASPLDLSIGLPVRSSPAFGEPGVFGIFRPVLLLPDKILQCLTAPEMESIVAHELCHVRRRDNLATVIHMAVEAVFWFHPLVWWLGARLMEERERACDEHVLRTGGDPRIYAEGILKTCELYLASPLACVSGVTGGDLKRRINVILAGPSTHKLNIWRKLLLTTAGVLAMAGPILVGLANAPRSRAQSQAASRPAFEVASIKPSPPGDVERMFVGSRGGPGTGDPGRYICENCGVSLLLREAFDLKPFQFSAPDWMQATRFHVSAKIPEGATKQEFRLMLQGLLEERFKLSSHYQKKEIQSFELVVAKNGPRMKEHEDQPQAADEAPQPGPPKLDENGFPILPGRKPMVRGAGDHLTQRFVGESMPQLASALSSHLKAAVKDATGLQGNYDFTLRWVMDGGISSAEAPGPTIGQALQDQLGLRVLPKKSMADVFIVDHIEKTPTGN